MSRPRKRPRLRLMCHAGLSEALRLTGARRARALQSLLRTLGRRHAPAGLILKVRRLLEQARRR
jgi:hypothetical protein